MIRLYRRLFYVHKLFFKLGIACLLFSIAEASPTTKTPIKGLVDMGDISFYNTGTAPNNNLDNITQTAANGIFGGVVINVTWAQLQPNDNDTITTTVIDQMLQLIEDYNSKNTSAPIYARLRVWGGFAAPDWIKELNGGKIQIDACKQGGLINDQKGQIGLWWEDSYLNKWQDLQTLLAQKYDDVQLIKEVSITSCASATDEPFIAWNDITVVEELKNKYGYRNKFQKKCISDALTHYRAWKNTLLVFPFNPFFKLSAETTDEAQANPKDDGGTCNVAKSTLDIEFTKKIMRQCVDNGQCILSNQSLNGGKIDGALQTVYQYINKLIKENSNTFANYQAASPTVLSDWCLAMKKGRNHHAQSVELWPSTPKCPGFTSLTSKQLKDLSNFLVSNQDGCQVPNPCNSD
ncbi:hypothetical protein L3V82_09620 [Thiotrichales bacterium 19S3-7]|nr:hypothetical protein [Thiotrichales bacterium 19S3-7]MCF6802416.1 hypothetical protein [Thiotrichales bacterium 19S3-11]